MEIERKFLVDPVKWSSLQTPADVKHLRQAWLSTDPDCSVRIRVGGKDAWLTVKGVSHGISRDEFEYRIPLSEGIALLGMAKTPVLEKRRYVLEYQGYVWEVDEFLGANEGLILAEVELADEKQNPPVPPWISREVSGDPRYFNLSLVLKPYSSFR